MTTKATQTNGKSGKNGKATAKPTDKPVQPNEFQQSLIDAGMTSKWVMANVTMEAPGQDEIAEWQAILSPLSEMVDTETIAQTAHDAFYGVEVEEVVEEEDEEPVEPVKSTAAPKSKKRRVAEEEDDEDLGVVSSNLGISSDMITMLLLGKIGDGGTVDFSSVLPIAQIVAGYRPNKPRSIYAQMLRSISQQLGAPNLIAVDAEGRVHRGATVANLEDLEQGYPGQDTYNYKGTLYQLVAVGIDPTAFTDADPIDPTKPLRRGVGIGNIDYTNASDAVRAVIYYAAKVTAELDDTDYRWLRKMLREGDTQVADLAEDFPQAIVRYNENRRAGTLPPLRTTLGNKPQPKDPSAAIPATDANTGRGFQLSAKW